MNNAFTGNSGLFGSPYPSPLTAPLPMGGGIGGGNASGANTGGANANASAQSDADVAASMCLTRLKRNLLSQTTKVANLEKSEAEMKGKLRSLMDANEQLQRRVQEAEDKVDVMTVTQLKDRENTEKDRRETSFQQRKEKEEADISRAKLNTALQSKSAQNELLKTQVYSLEDLRREDEKQIHQLRDQLHLQTDMNRKLQEKLASLLRISQDLDTQRITLKSEMEDLRANQKHVGSFLDRAKELTGTQEIKLKDLNIELEEAHLRIERVTAQNDDRSARQSKLEVELQKEREHSAKLKECLDAAHSDTRKLLKEFRDTQSNQSGVLDKASIS